MNRRQIMAASGASVLVASLPARAAEGPIQTRPIPVSGEALPIVGTGTVGIFNFENDPAKYAERRQVIQTLIAGGGKLMDSAASYGMAEARVGDLVADLGVRDKVFLATKFASTDPRDTQLASFQESLRRLKTSRVDLMQAWNVADPNYSLSALRGWKAQGLCRYAGITSSFDTAYDALAPVVKREKPDFFQINYSLGDRDAEKVLLPTAHDAGVAVLTNLPFGGGRNSLFKRVGATPLPGFAAEFGAKTWAQFFLKFLLSHPAVTAVIPGTDKPEYMLDNLGAGRGPMPDAATRKRMAAYWDALPGY